MDDEVSALTYCENQMRLMIEGKVRPYDAAWAVWAKAASITTSPDLIHPLWLIWGALTDWAENRPAEKSLAESAMIRAAQEWLSLPDTAARKAYLDRWIYDEMGYERPLT